MKPLWIALTFAMFCLMPVTSSSTAVIADDALRPEISGWGLEGDAKGGASFRAWADVSDDSSGVRNVTLIVDSASSYELHYPLPYNGSLYTEIIPPLAANATYELSLIAFDMANNSATSYSISVDRRSEGSIPVDPAITWPVVVPSSLALAIVVSLVACRYDRHHNGK